MLAPSKRLHCYVWSLAACSRLSRHPATDPACPSCQRWRADVPPVGPLAVVGVDGATGDTRLFPPVEEGGDPEDGEVASEGKLSGRFAAAMIGYVSLSCPPLVHYHHAPTRHLSSGPRERCGYL